MNQEIQKAAHLFCIGHLPLMFNPPLGCQILYLGAESKKFAPNEQYPSRHISELYLDLDAHHNFLAGCSGTMAVARLFESGQIPYNSHDVIYISQYRKFILLDALGKPAANYPIMHLVLPTELTSIGDIILDNIARASHGLILTQPLNVGNFIHHYTGAHKPIDLLRYVATAMDIGVLSQTEFFEFFNHPILISGGAQLGLYPIDVFLAISKQLEAVSLEFLRLHPPCDLSVYQRRAVSFCNERLGSYLLEKHIRQQFSGELPDALFGMMHTVIENEANTHYAVSV